MKKRGLKISYDKESDVLSFFAGSGDLDHVEELGPVIVHFDKKNHPLFVEILQVSKIIPQSLKKSPSLHKAA